MNTPSSSVDRGGLFRTADGKNFALTFVLISSLFLLWGFCNGMIDILNKHFQDTLKINDDIVIVGRPSRVPGEFKLLMVNLTRPSDGFSWGTSTGDRVE